MMLPRYHPADAERALLFEIVLRAAADWVLYRNSARPQQQQLAREAYIWLFDEGPGHRHWQERLDDGGVGVLYSFLAVCEIAELDPGWVRKYVNTLTRRRVTAMGRPRIYRRKCESLCPSKTNCVPVCSSCC